MSFSTSVMPTRSNRWLTLNINAAPSAAAQLVEYVLGGPDTPMGKLRARHGREQHGWPVTYFELGNEPSENYAAKHKRDDTAKGYVELARRTAEAVRTKADALGVKVSLLGVLEATFTVADWVNAVPMLERWNGEVLDGKRGLPEPR